MGSTMRVWVVVGAVDTLRASRHAARRLSTPAVLAAIISVAALQCEAGGAEQVGYWSLNEGTGSVANDSSGNGLHGTLIGNPTLPAWTAGQFGSALSFGSTLDYVQIPHDAALNFTTGFSLTFWIKAATAPQGDGGGGIATIIDKSHGGDNGPTGWAVQARATENGAISFALGNGSGFPEPRIPGVLDNTWHHVAILVNVVPSLTIRGYVDGVLATDYGDASTIIANNSGALLLGCWWGGGGGLARQFEGKLDDVRLYSGVLDTSCEVPGIANPTGFTDCNNNGLPDYCDANSDGVGPLEHRIFVSSSNHAGDLGGLDGADALCQALAESASLRRTYRAIMSDAMNPANVRLLLNGGRIYIFDSTGNRFLLKGNGNLWDGQDLLHAPNLDESGINQTGSVWTGTYAPGIASATNCVGWTHNTVLASGGVGLAHATNSNWIDIGATACNHSRRIYCVSQESDDVGSDCNNNGILDACEPPCNLSISAPAGVRFVRSCALPGGDGLNWGTAYGNLSDALAAAANSGGAIAHIWVAAGVYEPDTGAGQTFNNRSATFTLQNNLAIYGGFACGDDELADRDPAVNVTVLSGDLSGNDGPDLSGNGENSYHVISCVSGINATAVLDGFTIKGGNANGSPPNGYGGGLLANGGSPLIRNCKFVGNAGLAGGGIAILAGGSPTISNCVFEDNIVAENAPGGAVFIIAASNPEITDCRFSHNQAHQGGGIYAYNTSATISDCTFDANSANGAAGAGGGFFSSAGATPVLSNCVFSGNSASLGGAVASDETAAPVMTGCRFAGNSTSNMGGAAYHNNSAASYRNCLFTGNNAGSSGGGVCNVNSSPTFVNCTISGCTAVSGGGMANEGGAIAGVTNCILWGNSPTQIFNRTPAEDAIVTYSDIQGGWSGGGGTGNIASDPVFIDAAIHLAACSPCYNAGDAGFVAGPGETDLDGAARVIDGRVDMGAYELAATWWDCNLNLVRDECLANPACDANCDGSVNLFDIGPFVDVLTGSGPPCSACAGDANGDGSVNLFDIDPFVGCLG